ncbi:hypothetical protein AFM11_12895 [Mycolicibacterium wolinskyi]|uniref:Uncharacterized protein n=1 Tax=Mycolicibacterium wolinskyi TaxID=59750 RepID=A0A132PN42_9MYCO|nr:hypothetical protein [Mycolicibacterium wolinskyi]KWX23684.1 hypothetical protein AFM11_12895 [Mycolicibacterium wolinskyi]
MDAEQQDTEENRSTEAPEVTDEHRQKAKKIMEAYEDDRPTTTLPGSGGTVSGTMVNDWVDDDGKPVYGESKGDE